MEITEAGIWAFKNSFSAKTICYGFDSELLALRFNFLTPHIQVNLSRNSSNNNMSIEALQIETRHSRNAPLLVRTKPEFQKFL